MASTMCCLIEDRWLCLPSLSFCICKLGYLPSQVSLVKVQWEPRVELGVVWPEGPNSPWLFLSPVPVPRG